MRLSTPQPRLTPITPTLSLSPSLPPSDRGSGSLGDDISESDTVAAPFTPHTGQILLEQNDTPDVETFQAFGSGSDSGAGDHDDPSGHQTIRIAILASRGRVEVGLVGQLEPGPEAEDDLFPSTAEAVPTGRPSSPSPGDGEGESTVTRMRKDAQELYDIPNRAPEGWKSSLLTATAIETEEAIAGNPSPPLPHDPKDHMDPNDHMFPVSHPKTDAHTSTTTTAFVGAYPRGQMAHHGFKARSVSRSSPLRVKGRTVSGAMQYAMHRPQRPPQSQSRPEPQPRTQTSTLRSSRDEDTSGMEGYQLGQVQGDEEIWMSYVRQQLSALFPDHFDPSSHTTGMTPKVRTSNVMARAKSSASEGPDPPGHSTERAVPVDGSMSGEIGLNSEREGDEDDAGEGESRDEAVGAKIGWDVIQDRGHRRAWSRKVSVPPTEGEGRVNVKDEIGNMKDEIDRLREVVSGLASDLSTTERTTRATPNSNVGHPPTQAVESSPVGVGVKEGGEGDGDGRRGKEGERAEGWVSLDPRGEVKPPDAEEQDQEHEKQARIAIKVSDLIYTLDTLIHFHTPTTSISSSTATATDSSPNPNDTSKPDDEAEEPNWTGTRDPSVVFGEANLEYLHDQLKSLFPPSPVPSPSPAAVVD